MNQNSSKAFVLSLDNLMESSMHEHVVYTYSKIKTLIKSAPEVVIIIQGEMQNKLSLIRKLELEQHPNCKFMYDNYDSTITPERIMSSSCETITHYHQIDFYYNDSLISLPVHQRRILYIYGLWDDGPIPVSMDNLRKRATQLCHSFSHVVYGPESLLREFGQEIDAKIRHAGAKRKVVTADLYRYYLMQRCGGLYLDLDVQIRKNVEPLIDDTIKKGKSLVLFTEWDNCPSEYMGERENKSQNLRIYNCMFWSVPNHSFWDRCIELTYERCEKLNSEGVEWTDRDVLWASGPDVVTTVWHEHFKGDKDVEVVLSHQTFEYLVHTCAGSWRIEKKH